MAFGQMAHYTPFPGASLALPALPQATLNMAFGHHKIATKQSELHHYLASPVFMARDLKLSRLVDLLIRATHKYERRDVLPHFSTLTEP